MGGTVLDFIWPLTFGWLGPLSISLLICVPARSYVQRLRTWILVTVLLCLVPFLVWHSGTIGGVYAFVAQRFIPWLAILLVCTHAWPALRRKRIRVVAAAVLCITPLTTMYPWLDDHFLTVWPLILAYPSSIYYPSGGTVSPWLPLFYMALTFGAPIGFITWLLCKKYLPPADGNGSGSIDK